MRRPPSRIRWYGLSVAEAARLSPPATEATLPAVTERDEVRRMVERVGIPLVEGATTAKEYAIGLLQLAAEVEHALLAQYLYAAFSLPDDIGPDSINYHLRVMVVAIQEMGHLTTLQNLLLLLGGRDAIYMQRDLIRETSEHNPLPFKLEPVSKLSLAKYVAVEKPATVPQELEAKVAELVQLAEADAGVELHRVGVIYELLKWVFLPPDTSGEEIDFAQLAPLPEKPHLSDQDLQDHLQDVPLFEALAEEWEVSVKDVILPIVHTRSEALDALERVASQGEGLTNGGSSHFTEFMAVVAAFEAGNVTVKPVPKSPTLGDQTGELISHPYTRLWCEVFNLQYNLLVLTIYHALLTPRQDEGSQTLRAALARLALFGMRRVIHPIADLITLLPLRADGSADKAGPPFSLDASILAHNDVHELVAQHLRGLDALASDYTAIEMSEDFASFPSHTNTLANLRNFDKRQRNLLTPLVPQPN